VGQLAVMGQRGDTKIFWDPAQEAEVENARRTFEDLVTRKRYAAFSVRAHGEQGERVRTFDPAAESLILVPPIAGG
jgi:hypothetical protein